MKKTGYCLTGTLLALSLASLPALAQKDMKMDHSGWNGDRMTAFAPNQDKIEALSKISDAGIGKSDIIKILPLLQDLRDAKDMYSNATDGTVLVMSMYPDKTMGSDNAQMARQTYMEKRDNIWKAIHASIGDDKAMVVHRLVEPTKEKIDSTTMYRSTHLQRIDTLLAEWDRESAARLAQNGATPDGTSTTTTVSIDSNTKMMNDMATIPGLEVWTSPTITVSSLVDVLQEKVALMEGNEEGAFMVKGHYLTAPELRNLRERKLHTWK